MPFLHRHTHVLDNEVAWLAALLDHEATALEPSVKHAELLPLFALDPFVSAEGPRSAGSGALLLAREERARGVDTAWLLCHDVRLTEARFGAARLGTRGLFHVGMHGRDIGGGASEVRSMRGGGRIASPLHFCDVFDICGEVNGLFWGSVFFRGDFPVERKSVLGCRIRGWRWELCYFL